MNAAASWSVEEVKEALAGLSDDDRVELLSLINGNGTDLWYSLPGPQSAARYSEADVTGYGGQAGGGKTDLAVGLCTVDHNQSTIFRNEISQLESVKERLEQVVGSRKGFNGQTNVWRLGRGRRIRFGGFPNPGDEGRYQGNPNDLIVFDEAAEMREAAVKFVIGWNRSAKSKQRTRVLMTFNPPTRPEGRWIIAYFAPWLDKRHSFYGTVAQGELAWVSTAPDGEEYWLRDGRKFIWVNGHPCYEYPASTPSADIIEPMSRTFISARLDDNPFLSNGPYRSRLQNFPEPLRSQMLHGDFEAGMQDDEWQVIPTAWIQQSMARWRAAVALGPAFNRGPMSSLGVDVARGGRDKFVISPRYGRFFADLIRYPGKAVKNGYEGAGLVIKARRDNAPAHVDVIGYGSSTHDALQQQGIQSVGVNVGMGSMERTVGSDIPFFNLRAQLVWRLREALDPDGPDPIMLPDDLNLELDLAAYRYRQPSGKIIIMPKEEMKRLIGRSPDDGDAVCLALLDTYPAPTMMEQLADMVSGQQEGGDPWALWE